MRTVSARELVDACARQIARHEDAVQAFDILTIDLARTTAREVDDRRARGLPVGPLAGIPVAVKDVFATKGVPMRAGRGSLSGSLPDRDADGWLRLAEAGACLMGKTTTHEYAFGTTSGPTTNPWDRSRTPGGSSGGSAAAVAARMVPLAIGTDTAGSLRIPAAACGISTLRPAHGTVSTFGTLQLSSTFDVVGPMARRMRDIAFVIQIMAGPAIRPAPAVRPVLDSLRGIKIGLPETMAWVGIHKGIESSCRKALLQFEELGAEVVRISPPEPARAGLESVLTIFDTITTYEAYRFHLDNWLGGYTEQVRDRVFLGKKVSRSDYDAALGQRDDWGRSWRVLMSELGLDAIAHPTLNAPPKRRGRRPQNSGPDIRLSVAWPLADFPAVSIPVGFCNNLPVGLSLASRPEHESRLLDIAIALDEKLQMWKRRPGLPGEIDGRHGPQVVAMGDMLPA